MNTFEGEEDEEAKNKKHYKKTNVDHYKLNFNQKKQKTKVTTFSPGLIPTHNAINYPIIKLLEQAKAQ